ncbi:MAG: hypothetical protein JSW59_13345 [Phycisphaerales bacterium]|nr:MAG: hypothetical protein JSW59_13345 [Phycisphaerales bacterium]
MIALGILATQAEQYAQHNSAHWLILTQWILPLPIAALYVLLAVCIWRAAKYFGIAGKEHKLLRIETGKLAEEVHLLRRELGQYKDSDSAVRCEHLATVLIDDYMEILRKGARHYESLGVVGYSCCFHHRFRHTDFHGHNFFQNAAAEQEREY